jgi:hypothetical protein
VIDEVARSYFRHVHGRPVTSSILQCRGLWILFDKARCIGDFRFCAHRPQVRNRARCIARPLERDRRTSFLSGVLFHDRDISVGLICNHLPATPKARQNRTFGSALCQEHEAMAFLGPCPAAICFFQFLSRIKGGHRRPSRYTRSGIPRLKGLRRSRRSIAVALATAGFAVPAEWIAAYRPPLQSRREHDTLCHRTIAFESAVMAH